LLSSSVLFQFPSVVPRSLSPKMSLPPLKPDSASEANFQPLSASTNSCSSPILEPERSALLQEALADPQLQAVKAQLERRGLSIKAEMVRRKHTVPIYPRANHPLGAIIYS